MQNMYMASKYNGVFVGEVSKAVVGQVRVKIEIGRTTGSREERESIRRGPQE